MDIIINTQEVVINAGVDQGVSGRARPGSWRSPDTRAGRHDPAREPDQNSSSSSLSSRPLTRRRGEENGQIVDLLTLFLPGTTAHRLVRHLENVEQVEGCVRLKLDEFSELAEGAPIWRHIDAAGVAADIWYYVTREAATHKVDGDPDLYEYRELLLLEEGSGEEDREGHWRYVALAGKEELLEWARSAQRR